jgi:phospholipid/cholesterol/gamma-HCH transport system ATP-binding protein
MTIEPKLSISNLSKSFAHKHVLKGINLTLMPGESLVVIGGSGSGKSVLLKSILGLIKPDQGSIKLDGKETVGISGDEYNAFTRKFGFLFQGGALFDSLNIMDNITFGIKQGASLSKAKQQEISVELLQSVGLEPYVAGLYPAELSGGMQKRVALARAIANKPEVIFFDEPTTGLDPIMANIINDLIVKTSRTLGASTITITHDMHSVRKIADRVAMIHKGQILWCDTIDKLDNSQNPFVDQFINGNIEGPIQMELQDH